MTLNEFDTLMERANDKGITRHGVIVYSQDNWQTPYSLEARSYVVSSDNRRYQMGKISSSVFGSSLDGSDVGVRLDMYGWKVEDCYMLD